MDKPFHYETFSNCLVIPVTEKTSEIVPKIDIVAGCLVITVTENGVKLWSITLTGSEVLDKASQEAVFFQLATRYVSLETKKEKMVLLTEMESIILPKLNIKPMHRKSLIRKLRKAVFKNSKQRRGRRSKYNDIEKQHLVQLWKMSGYPCSKLLKALLPEWLASYSCSDQIKKSLLSMSPSRMDIFLKQARMDYQRKMSSGTVAAKNHIKKLIRLREPGIMHTGPGYMESDTVGHCGSYIWGSYVHTVAVTDLLSGWTEADGIFTKNADIVVNSLIKLRDRLPMEMKALFFDNGIEFINHLLVQAFKNNFGVDVARGRAGRSNDQAHIEQKNHRFVRQLFGHVRIQDPNLVPLMNEIYEIWGKLFNYFIPQMKLISKDRIGSKARKKYDQPKTPYQRLMECETFPEDKKEQLRKIKATLNPFELQAKLQAKLAYFHKLNDAYNRKIETRSS